MTAWQLLSWAIRLPPTVALIAHLTGGFGAGARAAAAGLALSAAPLAIRGATGRRLPWVAELPFLLAVSLESTSKSFNLPARIKVWDKIVHFLEIGFFSWLVVVLLRTYRESFNPQVPRGMLDTLSVFSGISLGTVWEMIELVLDRYYKQNLVKTIPGTILDLLVDSLGAIAGTAVGSTLYERYADQGQRAELGGLEEPLIGRSSTSTAPDEAHRTDPDVGRSPGSDRGSTGMGSGATPGTRGSGSPSTQG